MTNRWPNYVLAVLLGVTAAYLAGLVLVSVWGAVGLGLFVAAAGLLAAAFFVTVVYALVFGAPYVPVSQERLAVALELAELRPGELLVDLGSGDGRILIAAARRGVRTEGWEISPYLCLWSFAAALTAGVRQRVRIHWSSYWASWLGRADVVTTYLLPTQMGRLEKKLLAELRPGTRVVSVAFVFPHWKPVKEKMGVYLYVVS